MFLLSIIYNYLSVEFPGVLTFTFFDSTFWVGIVFSGILFECHLCIFYVMDSNNILCVFYDIDLKKMIEILDCSLSLFCF